MDPAAFEACAEAAVRTVLGYHFINDQDWVVFSPLTLPTVTRRVFTYEEEFPHSLIVAWDADLKGLGKEE